ncbi:hypothetical protein [Nocardia alni]|uniref:hypothetical protein n=1 Tax=Nocardia alni TaxID=2815723 RepID=UPI001C230360|nr:hypothetical protein [Nocardia alni]
MNLDEIWRSIAADNVEARDYLVRHERDLLPAEAAPVAAQDQPPLLAAGNGDGPPFAVEFEMENLPSLITNLVDEPHEQTDLFRMLTDVRPQQFRPALVLSLMELALRLEQDNDFDIAVSHLDEALHHSHQLTGPDRNNMIAGCLYQRSQISLKMSRFQEALHQLRKAAALAIDDTELAFTCGHARSIVLHAVSQIAVQEGNRTEAVSYLAERADVLQSLAQHDAAELPDLAITLNNLGALRFEDDHAAGRATVAKAIAIRRDLATADARTHLPGLAAALNNLGFLSLRMRDLDTARSSLTEAVSIRRGLADTEFETHGPPLLRSLNNLVVVLLNQDLAQHGDLLEATAEARAVAERLAAHDPRNTSDVAMTLLHFAEARVRAHRELEAARAAVNALLSTYRAQTAAMGLHQQARALRQRLAAD